MHSGPFALTGLLIPTYIVTSVPFTLGGICVSLALTRFPRQVSTLYAADLAGAAAGCLPLIGVLHPTHGPTPVIATAAPAAGGAAPFPAETRPTRPLRATLAPMVLP